MEAISVIVKDKNGTDIEAPIRLGTEASFLYNNVKGRLLYIFHLSTFR